MYDVAIIGGGPGGYVAAVRAAQLGAKVALIEQAELGGVCLNLGCIPTKAMLRSAEVYTLAGEAESFGVRVSGAELDFGRVMARKDQIVKGLVNGLNRLMAANGIEVLRARGHLLAPNRVEAAPGEGEPRQVEARSVILATGSNPLFLLLPGLDLPGVITSDGALALESLPASVVVVGGGVVGVEFASIFHAFGCRVTVVEMLPSLLPPADEEISRRLALNFRRRGIQVHTGTRLKAVEAAGPGDGPFGPPKRVVCETEKGETAAFDGEVVLIAIGRRPNLARLGLEAVGVRFDHRSGIQVDDGMQTSVPGVYAAGDVTGGTMLAHAAFAQGIIAAERAMGHPASWAGQVVPSCVFTFPEVAWAGLTEQQARARGLEVEVGRFPFAALGKAQLAGETDGLCKIIAERTGEPGEGRVLGVHLMGPAATELVQEGVLAVRLGVRARELADTIHPHPTLVEALGEAAHALMGRPLHQAGRRR